MVFTSKTAGLALLSLGLAARQAMAVDTCADLISEVGLVSGTGAIEITADLECPSHFEIASSQDVTITGGGFTITIGAGFAGSTLEDSGGGSLIVNEGTLTLEGITFKTLDTNGNRAVWNKGELHVLECTFELGHDGAYLDDGGVIYSNSARSIDITSSTFKSSVALLRGGALCADGSETLTIIDSEFTGSEVGIGLTSGEESSGGHLWLSRDVELQVEGSVFTNSGAAGSGGAIVCCGGSISTSNITSADSSSESEHFGAMLVGGRGEEECPRVLSLVDVVFIGNSALPTTGAGGALAIFDTSATITDCEFWGSSGTAVLFESTSTTGDHQLTLSTTQFNQNNNPSEAYYAGTQEQGSAIVITNTGVSDGESVDMGTFTNTYCFGNEPYECEMVYHGANIVEDGEFKCHICNEDGERQVSDTDEGFEDASSRSVDDGSSDNQGIVIGLSLALGLTLVVIGALAVWKFRVRKNARRLMEDMGESDL